MSLTFEACEICGAITTVRTDNGSGTDNGERHAEYHARLSAAIAEIMVRLDGTRPQ